MKMPVIITLLFQTALLFGNKAWAQPQLNLKTVRNTGLFYSASPKSDRKANIPADKAVIGTIFIKSDDKTDTGKYWWIHYKKLSGFIPDSNLVSEPTELKRNWIINDSISLAARVAKCESITCEVDKYEGYLVCQSPIGSHTFLIKKTIGKDTVYTLYLETPISSIVFEKGIYLLFEDGEKIIHRERQVETTVRELQYYLGGSVHLNDEELYTLQETRLISAKLYDEEFIISELEGEALKKWSKCIQSKVN